MKTNCVKIADEVVAAIAGKAVMEAEGVAGLTGGFSGDMKAWRKVAKGVILQVGEEDVKISVGVVVRGGVKIHVVAQDVQQRVKTAVETMTGFTASEVNVHVAGLLA